MSQDENLSNTKRRISTKYPKTHKMYIIRYSDFIQQCLTKYRIDNDLDVGTKTPKLLDGIVIEWFEMETLEEFGREDPDLVIKLRKEKDKTKWIDIIYDMDCDIGEIRALRGACRLYHRISEITSIILNINSEIVDDIYWRTNQKKS